MNEPHMPALLTSSGRPGFYLRVLQPREVGAGDEIVKVGEAYKTASPSDLPAGARWSFDHPFFIILNVAVGGDWPKDPDSATVFPQAVHVDYVRVYQRQPS